MNIQQGGPEEQDEHLAASWRELKMRRGISLLVMLASIVSVLSMMHSGAAMFVLNCIGVSIAVVLADRLIMAFRCPRCGLEFFRPSQGAAKLSPYGISPCVHCGLPLWKANNSPPPPTKPYRNLGSTPPRRRRAK